MKWLTIILLMVMILVVSGEPVLEQNKKTNTGITISQDVFLGYRHLYSTGNDSIIFDGSKGVIIKDMNICLIPQIEDNALINKVRYKIPNSYPLLDRKSNLMQTVNKAQLTNSFCIDMTNPMNNLFLKFGYESIIIVGDTAYDSNDTNVTQETGFAHLNLSNDNFYNTTLAYWSFDGDKENTKLATHFDYSKNNKDGTGVADALVNDTDCMYGDCLQLDGTGDYVNLGDDPDFEFGRVSAPGGSDNVTMMAWIKTTGTSGTIFGNTYHLVISGIGLDDFTGYRLFVDSNGKFAFGYGGGGTYSESQFSSNKVVNDGNWHHVVAVWDTKINNQGNLSLYIDGVFNKGFAGPYVEELDYYDGCIVRIGRKDDQVDALPEYFNGQIDEIMVFNGTLLTAEQISDIYTNQSNNRVLERGELNFSTIDLGINDTFNATFTNCSMILGSNISVRTEDDDECFVDIVTCNAVDCETSGGEINPIVTLYAGDNNFFTPIFGGNITIDGFITEVETCYILDTVSHLLSFPSGCDISELYVDGVITI